MRHCGRWASDDASADDESVRALLGAQFERGDAEDYVQLKDVAALLEAHHPDCHARLCLKAGTRVPSNEALAATVSRVLGLKVRNEQVTLPGQVKARGPIRGFRKVCAYPEATPRVPRGYPEATPRFRPVGSAGDAPNAALHALSALILVYVCARSSQPPRPR